MITFGDKTAVPYTSPAAIPFPTFAEQVGRMVDALPLRKAALETLLSGALLLTEVRRITASQSYGQVLECEKRFTAAMEMLREALA